MKKVTVHAGHNKQGHVACGASDYLDESKECRYIKRLVVKGLKKRKVKVVDCTVNNGTSQNDVLRKIIKKTNDADAQMNVALHMNAFIHSKKDGKTKGVEVCVYDMNDAVTYALAKKICNSLEVMGFENRGIKERKDLAFLRKTKRRAILVEICFVDDQDDAILYRKNKEKIADAITTAIFELA